LHRHHGHNAALKATDFDAVCGMESNYCRVTGYSEVWSGPQQKSNRRSFVAVLLRMTTKRKNNDNTPEQKDRPLHFEGSGTRKGERRSRSLTHPRFARMGEG